MSDPGYEEAAAAAASSTSAPSEEPESTRGDHDQPDVPTVDVDSSPDDGGEVLGQDAATEPQPSETGEVDPFAALQRERDEYLDHLRRERAEFENFRRRANKERMEALDRGAQHVVMNLLHVLDTFGLALQAADDRDGDPLAKGVSMVHDELLTVLRTAGLEDVPGVGAEFDPVHHEAVMSVEAEDPTDEPVVVEVLRPGYRFKGRVLRPASVKVAH